MSLTTAEILADAGLLAIGSAIHRGGLRACFKQHIDKPERPEQAALACRCGFNHLAMSWVEAPNRRTAMLYESALLRAYFQRHGRLPALTSLTALETAEALPTEEDLAEVEWTDLHALVQANRSNVPLAPGIWAVTAVRPDDPEIWDPPRGELWACPFSKLEPGCRPRAGASCGATGAPKAPRRERPVVIDLRDDVNHNWLHEVRRRRLEREGGPRRRLEDFLE